MAFDIRTIAFILALVSGLLAFMFLVYWKTQKTYNGFHLWAGSTLIMAVAYFLIMLRGTVPDLVSIILANLLLALGVLMRADGIRRFFGGTAFPALIYLILLPFTLLIVWLTYGYDSIALRSALLAAVLVPALVYIGYRAIRSSGNENRFIHGTFGLALIAYALIYAVRTLFWIVVPPETVFSTDELNTLFFILTMVMELLAAGFFLMLNLVRAQADVAAGEERYRILAENLPDYVVVHDGRNILYANPATARFAGLSSEALLSVHLQSFIAPGSRSESELMMREMSSVTVPARPHEIVITSKDGRSHTCIVQSVPVTWWGTAATLSVLTDITERKQVEEALRTTNKKLNLLSGITRHDIKNQLLALGAFLALGAEPAAPSQEVQEYIRKSIGITGIIGRQINFTRDYENLGISSPQWQDAGVLVTNAAASLPIGRIRVETECAGIELFADPLLEKVFFNLIDNSLRYGGEKMTKIRLHCNENDRALQILFEDDGNGISEEDKPELFQKGFGKNTGLGLFFIREILSITGMTITENGVPGAGARFEILAPEGTWRHSQAKKPKANPDA
ncbi:MAG: PAS domain S-box protein [Methanomicrobiales archaeon]|nr:PAS domain S-box protein [Methanomicrobiales archaeon]